jgi:N utilization substance protein B
MPAVDRAILRLGIWELANTPTPPAVVIDEAIELAREFSTSDSPKFVNGVLDKVLKEREALIGGLEAPAAGGEEPRTTDH